MKFSATVGELARALGLVSGVVEAKTTIPILAHVLLRAMPDNRVLITGTDLERDCTASAPAEVGEVGAVAVPGGIFKGVITRLPKAATVNVSVGDNGRVSFTVARSRFAMASLDGADFPEAKAREGAPFTIEAKKLAALLEATIEATSTEETRFYLCGVFLHASQGALVAVATDGHRLSKRHMDLPAGAEHMPPVIISTKGVATLVTLLGGIDGKVTLWITKARLWLETPHAQFSTALINAQYPDYQRVIPQYNGAAATFSGADFCAAIERAASTLPEARAVPASVIAKPDGLGIEVGPRGSETAVEHIEAEFGGEGEVSANAKYLAAMTKVYGTAPIEIHIRDSGSPIVFTSKALPEQLYLIMPLRR